VRNVCHETFEKYFFFLNNRQLTNANILAKFLPVVFTHTLDSWFSFKSELW